MKKNRKQRRAEIKTLPQVRAKRVLTEAERKDHEYRLREKWTERDTKELVKTVVAFLLIELFFLPLTIHFIPANYLINDDDVYKIEVRPIAVYFKKRGTGVRAATKIIIESNESKYEIVATGTRLMNVSGMTRETVATCLIDSDTIELWVLKDENNVVALETSSVSWSIEEYNEELLKDCKVSLPVCILVQTFALFSFAIYCGLTFSNKRFR